MKKDLSGFEPYLLAGLMAMIGIGLTTLIGILDVNVIVLILVGICECI